MEAAIQLNDEGLVFNIKILIVCSQTEQGFNRHLDRDLMIG
jgi:hypothetical protein